MKMKLRYELFKLCKSKVLIALFTLCVSLYCILCVCAQPDLSEYTFDPKLYKMYAEKYSGKFTQQTLEEMNSELEQLTQQSQQPLENKAFTAEEYIKADNKRIAAQQKANALGAVIERYQQLKGGSRLVYDLEINAYHTGWLRKLGLLLCLALITVITLKITLDDHKCGMEQILFTTAAGKCKLLCAKLFIAALLAFITAVLFGCAELLLLSHWDLGDTSAPLQSFRGFETGVLTASMQTALYLSFVLKVLLFAAYSAALMLFSRLTRSDIAAVCITLVLASIVYYLLDAAMLIC